MDRQDFQITADETFDLIQQALDRLAIDGVEAYPVENGLKLMFDDGNCYELLRNDGEQTIEARMDGDPVTLYWDEVEEAWFARGSEEPLAVVLSAALGKRIGRNADFTEHL
jgi:frataxin-like iron-binding protein CyaY